MWCLRNIMRRKQNTFHNYRGFSALSVYSKCHRTGFRKSVNHERSPTFAIGSRRLVHYIHRGLNSPLRNNCFCRNLLFMVATARLCLCAAAVGDALRRFRVLPVHNTAHKITLVQLQIRLGFVWVARDQKCPTGYKSTLELACLTRFQPRLSCLFIVIGLTMSLRCGFEWSACSRSPVIVLRAARACVCVSMIRHVYRLTVDSPLNIHNCLATERL
jgi:hypothetical protein